MSTWIIWPFDSSIFPTHPCFILFRNSVKPKANYLILEGLPELIKADEEIEMSCTVIKIKPQAAYIEWDVAGKKIHGRTIATTNADVKTFCHKNVLIFK